MSKLYRLYCDQCNWSRYTDGTDVDDLYEIKSSSVQRKIPVRGPDGKMVESKFRERIKRYRCPQCGHAVRPKKVENSQAKLDEKMRIEEQTEKRKKAFDEQDFFTRRQKGLDGPEVPGPSAD